jgi:GAF domain-containing protein
MVVSLRDRMTDLRTIYEIGNSISSSVELRPTLYYLIRALAQAVPHDGAEICLYNKDNNQMIMNLSVGKNVGQTLTTSRTYEITGFLTDLVGKQTVMVRDMAQVENAEQNEPRAWQQFKPRSYLGVPLVAKNKVIGTIELVSSQPDGFSEDNKRILESIAIQAAIAIQNAQEVETREKDLKQQIVLLKIEVDEAKKSRQVSEIVESEYFQILRQKAKDMRAKRE